MVSAGSRTKNKKIIKKKKMEGKVEQIFDVTLGIELRTGKTVFSDL